MTSTDIQRATEPRRKQRAIRSSAVETPRPWYLKPWVLALWGLTVVLLIATIIYGLVILATGNGGGATGHHAAVDNHTVVKHTGPDNHTVGDHPTTTAPPTETTIEPPPPVTTQPGRSNVLIVTGGTATCPRYPYCPRSTSLAVNP